MITFIHHYKQAGRFFGKNFINFFPAPFLCWLPCLQHFPLHINYIFIAYSYHIDLIYRDVIKLCDILNHRWNGTHSYTEHVPIHLKRFIKLLNMHLPHDFGHDDGHYTFSTIKCALWKNEARHKLKRLYGKAEHI